MTSIDKSQDASLRTPLWVNVEERLRIARHVFFVSAPIGIVVGCAVAGYDYIVNTLLWTNFSIHLSPITLSLLPILGMFLTGAILSIFRVPSSSMADEVVRAYHTPHNGIDYKTATPKLLASMATMGFGASAGMEGASKWLGGTLSSFIQTRINKFSRLRFLHGRVETTMLAGAAAGIGAIFRAPLTGAIMGIESPFKNDLAHDALIHGLVASALSYATFTALRPATPYFPITFTYQIHVRDLLYCVPVGILAGVSSHVFLWLLKTIKKYSGRWMIPSLFKFLLGGIFVSLIALLCLKLLGKPVTLQAGLPVANELLNGHYLLLACLLVFAAKLAATAFTFGMGGVGGLFVPSATIGAALGAACDIMFSPSQPGLFTLVGIAAFTGASYNSLLFSAVFIAEATGSPMLVVPGLLASSTAFLISSGISNSQAQKNHRTTDEAHLAVSYCRDWMTTKIVVARTDERLHRFLDRALKEHRFHELPVVNEHGAFQGMAALESLREFGQESWPELSVEKITKHKARTLCPTHSMADVEQELANGTENYIPIVDPMTDQLVGIVSSTDVLRARQLLKKEVSYVT